MSRNTALFSAFKIAPQTDPSAEKSAPLSADF